jgi:hypothetical protein
MNQLLRKLIAWLRSPSAFPLFLLFICLAAFAPFLTRLGFYWDDYPINWIATTMGGDGLARYFSTNRPVWGLLYRLTTPILGSQPLAWQVAALLLRWASGLALWGLLRLAWPGRLAFAAWASLLFVIYPGFVQQHIAYVYSHFYIILILFLLSFSLTLLALRHPRYFWPLTLAALAASAFQMLSMEYFLLLELLRPVLIWLVLGQTGLPWRKRLSRAVLLWLPYLVIMLGAIAWRSLLLGFQTYQPTLMSRLRADPIPALLGLLQTALKDVWAVLYGAWSRAFQISLTPARAGEGVGLAAGNPMQRILVMAVTLAASLVYLLLARSGHHQPRPVSCDRRAERGWLLQPLATGALAMFIAGGPFWLTDLQIGLVFPNDRFTLPFMLGTSLFTAALLLGLPRPHLSGAILLSAGLAAAVGLHFVNGSTYRQDWSRQQAFFWQMTWRAPALQPGTVLLTNDLPFGHYTDNSLSAALNWVYDPDNDPQRMDYILYYPTLRKKTESWLVDLRPGQAIERDYLATTFYGSSSQVITLVFDPPACLRILDPEIDPVNWMVPQTLRETLALATQSPVLAHPAPGQAAPHLPSQLFGKQPKPNWCYYFEKADLARQLGDWEQVIALAELAFESGDYPNDPAERLPFIEGYAHSGNWARAVELSEVTRAITPAMQPVLCRLWQRIAREIQSDPGQLDALRSIREANQCTW